ncbi:hypothetical protein F4781DRAFT_137368 [Annulohypoxylon bovei var. microspora]|nr:hypothetical protein F4781DRAFT_137368 [Annulohypoxylon bovei var. microspora]
MVKMPSPYLDPNYNPYPSSVLIGTAILFMIIPIAAVSLRFYARLMSAAKLGVDDWFTLLSMDNLYWAFVDGHVAHTKQLYTYEKTKYAYEVFGTFGLCVIKLSVLFFYRRIFSVNASRIANNILISITVLWGIAYTLACAFQCTPAMTLWTNFEWEYGDSCVELQPFYLSIAVSDLILDVIIFVAPVPHLYMLQLPLRQKIAVGGIFLLGTIVIAIGITRIVICQWVISFSAAEPLIYFSDITWYTAGTLFWHLVENVVGLLGCCLPTYAPLFRSYLDRRKIGGGSSYLINSNLKDSKKRTQLPLYHQRLEDEETSLRPAAAGSSSANSKHEVLGDYALESKPKGRIMVDKEFRAETSLM